MITALILTATLTHAQVAVWCAQNGYDIVPSSAVTERTYDLPSVGFPVKWMEVRASWLVQWPEFRPSLADSLNIKGSLRVWSDLGQPKMTVRAVSADTVAGPWTVWR